MLEKYDPVKVVTLQRPARHFHGTEGAARAPRIGDTGIIVAISGGRGDRTYVVESVDPEGMTVWLADFQEEELEKGDESIRANYYIPENPNPPLYLLGAFLGAVAAYLIAAFWLELSPAWIALLFGAIAALFGVFMLENIGEAIILGLIIGVLMAVLLTTVPGLTTVKSVVLPLACGFVAGKFVVGIWKEIR